MRNITRLIIPIITAFLLSTSALAAEKVFFYHTDPAGTPLAMTDSSGTVIWKADYRPFGEEQSINPQTQENDMKFVGKEKDKETGLYYFGARYLKGNIGRFITPDPLGPVDPRTSKTNYVLVKNPQRLNLYAYSLNNPYKYVDPDGKWAEDVHSGSVKSTYGTYTWARQAGFSPKEARAIANGNNRTDGGPWTSFMPFGTGGDQSRHFNEPYSLGSILGDTRDVWAKLEYQMAAKYMEEGNIDAALGHLGKGLHSLQDEFAHRDWDTGVAGMNRHPDWYDDWHDPRNREASDNTRKATLDYLRSFKEKFKPEGNW